MPGPLLPLSSPADLGPRRISGLGRVAVALAVTALTSVQVLPLPSWSAWVGGLIWLPAATWLWFAEEGPPRRWRTLLGLAADLLALTSIMLLAPDLAGTALLLAIPLAAAATSQAGVGDGMAVTGAALLAWWLSAGVGTTGADLIQPVATVLVSGSVVLIMAWARALRRQQDRQAAGLADTAAILMTRTAEALVVTDTAGVIVQTNPAADRVLMTDDQAPLVDGRCSDQLGLHTSAGRALDCRDGCALAVLCRDQQQEAVELWRVISDRRQPLLASAVPIRTPAEGTLVLHSFLDITRLKQADEAKTMFLATASHELKTPLTVIRGFTQLLQGTTTDPDARIALDAIESRSAELAAIVDRLLLSSRIEAGRVELTAEPVDLSDLLATRLPRLAESCGRQIVSAIPPGLRALGSAQAVTTVLEQLVDNAAKYSGPDATITVRARAADGSATIEVSDAGIGMADDQAARCFDKFWQAESSDVRRFGGTGIGLYIVRSLVEAMEGTVEVTSTPGRGTTFTVRLPQLTAAVPADGPGRTDAAADHGRRVAPAAAIDEFMTQLGISGGTPS